MSYALKPQERGSVRTVAASEAQPAHDTASKFELDIHKVQGAVEAIKRDTAYIHKQAALLSATHRCTPGTRTAHEVARAARAAGEEARRLLQGLSAAPGGSLSEQSAQRLRRDKLSESLLLVLSQLEASCQAHEAAEAARCATDEAARNAAGEVSAESLPAKAGDLELGRAGPQLQELDLVAEAELDMHATIVNEYTEQAGRVARHAMEMRRALLDLADLAQSQGAVVDTIEQNMSQATASTSGATEQIAVSRQKQKQSMKCIWRLLLLTVLVGAATVALTNWKR